MAGYEENDVLGYVYDDNNYASTQGGLKVSALIKKGISKNFQLNVAGKVGYKINKGDSQNIHFQVQSTTIDYVEESLDKSGLYIEPQISLSYSEGKIVIEGEYSYEYMENNYVNNQVKIYIKYSI